MKKTLNIKGMSCNHCVMHVTNALKEIEGVNDVNVSLEENIALVEVTDQVTNEALKEAIDEVGYQVTEIK